MNKLYIDDCIELIEFNISALRDLSVLGAVDIYITNEQIEAIRKQSPNVDIVLQ